MDAFRKGGVPTFPGPDCDRTKAIPDGANPLPDASCADNINATGEDIVISDTEDRFVFPNGTLTVIHAPVRSKDHFNDKKCTGSFREAGTYVISEGTDQYEGVTGSGTYRVVGRFHDGCEGTPTGTFTITARGSINFPSS